MKEERVPHPGNPLHQLGDQAEQTGNFRRSEESAAAGLQQTGQRETSIDTPGHLPALPSPGHVYTAACGSQALKVGLQLTDPGSGLGLAAQRQPKGTGVWSGHNWGFVQNRARFHHRSPIVNAQVKGGAGPPLGDLGATGTSGLPTHEGRAEI